MNRVLVVDDDPAQCRLLQSVFKLQGHEVVAVNDGRAGLARACGAPELQPDIVFLDIHLPDLDGLEVLERIKSANPTLPVVMLTGDADVKTAVRATQMGAFDYLTKPFNHHELVLTAQRALEMRALSREVNELRRKVHEGSGLGVQMGSSQAVRDVVEQVRVVADTAFSVLVLGETGTGKELVAQAIHKQSARGDKPFIALDCGAIPEPLLESELFGHEKGAFTGAERRTAGQFRLAEGGTFFLDEVGNLPLGLQAKLLRVLESRQLQSVGATKTVSIDVRFVAATNDDLQARAADGRFRADLYFRLAQYTISLPPLRARPDDIPYLAGRFLKEVSVELRRPVQGISPEALALLKRHDWPGNVRELRNVVRRAVLESKDLVLERAVVQRFLRKQAAAPAAAATNPEGMSLKEAADNAARAAERQIISASLRVTRGNKSQTARALRTDYKTLHLKMKSLGIRGRDFAP